MAASRNTTAKDIQPLRGAIVIRGTVGATVAAGEIVEMQDDGYWDPADASAVITGMVGIALNAGSTAGTDRIDIVTHGPVECVSGATEGAPVYVSNDAGEYQETAGSADKDTIIGHAISETVIYVDPQIVDFS
jgi:hypothetical protein